MTVLELMERNGEFATHLGPDDPDGFPGWHAIHGGIIGWGLGERYQTVKDWAMNHPLLPALAPALTREPFERDHLIGVKLFFGSYDGVETAEVRVNGRVHEPACALNVRPRRRTESAARHSLRDCPHIEIVLRRGPGHPFNHL
jgi:hypothetical protein